MAHLLQLMDKYRYVVINIKSILDSDFLSFYPTSFFRSSIPSKVSRYI